MEIEDRAAVTPDVGALIKTLWQDDGVQAAYERRNEFQIYDSVK